MVVLQHFSEVLIFKQISHLPTLALYSFMPRVGLSVYESDSFQMKLNWEMLSSIVFNVLQSHMGI